MVLSEHMEIVTKNEKKKHMIFNVMLPKKGSLIQVLPYYLKDASGFCGEALTHGTKCERAWNLCA